MKIQTFLKDGKVTCQVVFGNAVYRAFADIVDGNEQAAFFQAAQESLALAKKSEEHDPGAKASFGLLLANRVLLPATVFPSTEQTIVSLVTDDKFKGAHNYEIKPMLRYQQGYHYDIAGIERLLSERGFPHELETIVGMNQGAITCSAAGKEILKEATLRRLVTKNNSGGPIYGLEGMPLTFVKTNADGTWQPGVQTEQVLYVLADRHEKMNEVFPDENHAEFMGHIQGAIGCLGRRQR